MRNQSVIPKSTSRRQVVINNHPEKQTGFANKKVVPAKASYVATITTGRKQTKKVNTNHFGRKHTKGYMAQTVQPNAGKPISTI